MLSLKGIHGLNSVISEFSSKLNIKLNLKVDNRQLDSKSAFIAIVGERFNPLKHLQNVIMSNCEYVIYEQSLESDHLVEKYKGKINFIKVNSILNFIQEAGKTIADNFRKQGGILVGISGSNGKTTTKEMLFVILSRELGENKVICTQKNNNNHIGVPFTLFQISENTSVAIIELGSNHPGEIEALCKIVNPQYGVTTNIGDTHLEFFQNRENVFLEESILHKYCTVFFQNLDDELLSKIDRKSNWIPYGVTSERNKIKFINEGIKINQVNYKNQNITGSYNFINLGLAIIIAQQILGKNQSIVESVKNFVPTANRSEWTEFEDMKVFLDAYNANPSSMKAAINGFAEHLSSIGAKTEEALIVLGDMNELGANAGQFHEDLGDFLNRYKFGQVYLVGAYSKYYAKSYKGNSRVFRETKEVEGLLREADKKYVFIKGSRSLHLETILDKR
jgi:UDP-N-acetylmuramoyl-tripeptide--D-alanyl-D-alanine ligase